MPIYEYHCRKCGNDFELVRPVAKMDMPAPCLVCRSKATSRKMSTFTFSRMTRPNPVAGDAEPDEYEAMYTDHSDDEDWADY